MLVLLPAVLLSALQLASAIDVYLNTRYLSSANPTATLARHLGLDAFEPLHDPTFNDHNFVGEGSPNALLFTIDELDAKLVLPPSFQPAFKLSSPSVQSLSSVVSTYLHRAAHSFSSIYDSENRQLDDVDDLAVFFETAESPSFAALELTKVSELRQIYGSDSTEYLEATAKIRQFLAHASSDPDSFHLAFVTFSTTPLEKREPQVTQSPLPPNHPPFQEPIGAVSTCFTSAASCNNSTNSCSGRGQCLEATKSGRTCFVCTCGVTRTGEGSKVKTDTWVGQSCERKDISGPFVLLTGTVIVLLVLVIGSVSLLSSMGSIALPNELLATTIGVKKD